VSQGDDSKECCTGGTDEIRLTINLYMTVTYKSVKSFRHQTSWSRNRILDSNQDAVGECAGGNILSTCRIDQRRGIGVSRTIAVGLDDFSKSTCGSWSDVDDVTRGGKLQSIHGE
jgi:hypothetical protein